MASVAAYLMKTSGNLQIRKWAYQEIKLRKNIRKSGERREGLKASVAICLTKISGILKIRKWANQEIRKSSWRKNIRKSGKGREGLKASVAISLAQFRLPLMFHLPSSCSTHWSHWSALINNSLPLKPDFHASLNKFVVGPAVGCCHI